MFEWCAHILRLGPHDQDWIVHLKNLSWTCVFCCVTFLHVLVDIWACFGADPKLGQICQIHFHVKLCPLRLLMFVGPTTKKHPNYSTVTYLLFKNQMKVMVRCASWSLDGVPPTSFTHRCSHLWRFGWTLKDWVLCFLLMCHVCIDGYFFTRKKFHLFLILWDTETHCPILLIRFLRNHQTSSRLLVTPTGPT